MLINFYDPPPPLLNILRFLPGGGLGRSWWSPGCVPPLGPDGATTLLQPCPAVPVSGGSRKRWLWWLCSLHLTTWGSTDAASGCKLPSSYMQREGARWRAFAERCFGAYRWLTWVLLPVFKPCKNHTAAFLPNPRIKKKKKKVVSIWCNWCLENRKTEQAVKNLTVSPAAGKPQLSKAVLFPQQLPPSTDLRIH